MTLASQAASQTFGNDYQLVDGEAMHEQFGEQFQIPPGVIKRYLTQGHFVELRIDSPRFSTHQEDLASCTCPSCNGEMAKPILRHEAPASLETFPPHTSPSRGWGEDFWICITDREGPYFAGRVDNQLVESRFHGLSINDTVTFHEHHILAVHPSHRLELVQRMQPADVRELVDWLRRRRTTEDD